MHMPGALERKTTKGPAFTPVACAIMRDLDQTGGNARDPGQTRVTVHADQPLREVLWRIATTPPVEVFDPLTVDVLGPLAQINPAREPPDQRFTPKGLWSEAGRKDHPPRGGDLEHTADGETEAIETGIEMHSPSADECPGARTDGIQIVDQQQALVRLDLKRCEYPP